MHHMALKKKILETSSEFQRKHLTAILCIPVLSGNKYNSEYKEATQDAIESAVQLLNYLQKLPVIDRVRTLYL